MKINSQIENYLANKTKSNENSFPQKTQEAKTSLNEDRVSLSQEGVLKSKSIDNTQKINQLKQDVENGTYNIDSDKVSNAILDMDKLFS